VERYIILVDVDRPGKTFEVDVLAVDERVLKVAVPNTVVQFSLFRRGRAYEGALGGRIFRFTPTAADAQKRIRENIQK
jgi:hypothetical protein